MEFQVKAIEIRDSFHPERLLEVRFVLCVSNGINGRFYDMKSGKEGYSSTGRTFRTSYGSLMELYLSNPEPREMCRQ